MSEIHWLFEEYNKLNTWGRFKRLLRGLVGLCFAIPLTIMTAFFILIELGNKALDILFEEESE